ncbi:hypothetical protein UF75_1344 [Desulfosporosinus sp. I2]|nr:hypothetical protein UF75_1344 [Desulfosporosinus sp. I2]
MIALVLRISWLYPIIPTPFQPFDLLADNMFCLIPSGKLNAIIVPIFQNF